MSSPRQHAPPRAWQSLGLAAPRRGAARPVRVPSGTRRGRDNNAIVHAARGKAAGNLLGIDRVAEHACTSLRLQEPHSLWWQAAMLPRRYTCSLRAGDAEGSRGAFRVTRALDEGARELRHRLTARWLADQLCTSRRWIVQSVLPLYNDARGVLVVPQRSQQTVPQAP